jgi:signal transduction histidine kinase
MNNTKNNTKFSSLVKKLLTITLSIYFIITIIVTSIHAFIEYKTIKENVMDALINIEYTFKNSLTETIWDMDDDTLNIITNDIVKLPSVSKLEVIDTKKKTVISKEDKFDKNNNIKYKFEIVRENYKLGHIVLYANEDLIFTRLKDNFTIIIINAIIKTTALILLFLWSFNKILARPLNEFINQIENINFNNIDKNRIDIKNHTENNELTKLQNSFNEMIENILKSKHELEDYKDNLEKIVYERTKDLKQQKTKLEKTVKELESTQDELIESSKMAYIGKLISSIAHELNTPLGAINSNSKMISDLTNTIFEELINLKDKLNTNEIEKIIEIIQNNTNNQINLSTKEERTLSKELKEYIDIHIDTQNSKLLSKTLIKIGINKNNIDAYSILIKHTHRDDIIKSIQTIVNIKSNSQNIQKAIQTISKTIFALNNFSSINNSKELRFVEIQKNIKDVLNTYQSQFGKNIQLIENYENLNPIQAYEDIISQVWINLVQNAIHAIKDNGVIEINLYQKDNYQIISIKDNGCGIEDNIQKDIFKPFFTTKADQESRGLGLGIIEKIVKKHNGKIEFNSKLGLGTEFFVYLPLNQPIDIENKTS